MTLMKTIAAACVASALLAGTASAADLPGAMSHGSKSKRERGQLRDLICSRNYFSASKLNEQLAHSRDRVDFPLYCLRSGLLRLRPARIPQYAWRFQAKEVERPVCGRRCRHFRPSIRKDTNRCGVPIAIKEAESRRPRFSLCAYAAG